MWPFKGKNQDADKPLTKEERADLVKKMKAATKELAKMKETLNLASAKDIIEFEVSTIHKDRRGIILSKVMSIDKNQSYDTLRKQWDESAKAKDKVWLGAVKASGPREKLVSVMHKIAKEGGTITVHRLYELEVPPARKWWDAEWEEQMEREKEEKKKEKADSKKDKADSKKDKPEVKKDKSGSNIAQKIVDKIKDSK